MRLSGQWCHKHKMFVARFLSANCKIHNIICSFVSNLSISTLITASLCTVCFSSKVHLFNSSRTVLPLQGIKATRCSPMSDWSQEGRRMGKKRSFPCDIFFEVTTKGWSGGLRGNPHCALHIYFTFHLRNKEWVRLRHYLLFFFFSTDWHPAHFLPSHPLSAKLNCYFFFQLLSGNFKSGHNGQPGCDQSWRKQTESRSLVFPCHRKRLPGPDVFMCRLQKCLCWSSLEYLQGAEFLFLKAQLLQQLNLNMDLTHQLHLLLSAWGVWLQCSWLSSGHLWLPAPGGECFRRGNHSTVRRCEQKGWMRVWIRRRRIERLEKVTLKTRCFITDVRK